MGDFDLIPFSCCFLDALAKNDITVKNDKTDNICRSDEFWEVLEIGIEKFESYYGGF